MKKYLFKSIVLLTLLVSLGVHAEKDAFNITVDASQVSILGESNVQNEFEKGIYVQLIAKATERDTAQGLVYIEGRVKSFQRAATAGENVIHLIADSLPMQVKQGRIILHNIIEGPTKAESQMGLGLLGLGELALKDYLNGYGPRGQSFDKNTSPKIILQAVDEFFFSPKHKAAREIVAINPVELWASAQVINEASALSAPVSRKAVTSKPLTCLNIF